MKLGNFPEDVIKQYGLRDKVNAKAFVILRVEKACMGYHTQELLLKASSLNGYMRRDTIKLTRFKGFDSTIRGPSVLP